MEEGYCLFINGKVQTRWNKEDEWEFKITRIEMLNETREKYINKMEIKLNAANINAKTAEMVQNLAKNFPGNSNIFVNLYDSEQKISLRLLSTKLKINPQNEVLEAFDKMGILYSFN